MANTRQVNRELERKLQALWLRAKEQGELFIPCDTKAIAEKLRFSMYRAVKHIRAAPESNPTLAEAVTTQECSIREEPTGIGWKFALRIGLNEVTMAADAVCAALGVTGDEVPDTKTEVELSAERLMARIREEQAGREEPPPVIPSVPNPYYTREE